tara:strand:+ start:59723 stop:60793 length:1071 start_codon:yes stop_codon:yes gene_type:complete
MFKFSRQNLFIVIILILTLLGALFGFYTYNQNQKLNSASYAVELALQALQNQDLEKFQKYVDTKLFAENILTEVFEEDDTAQTEETGFWGAVKTLGDSLSNRLTGYIKPELANSLNNQILEYVKKGAFSEKYDITNLYGRTPMLQKIWYDLAGEEFVFKGLTDTVENGEKAHTSFNFYRKDLDFSSSIKINLIKKESGWKVVGVEDLGHTLKQLDTLRIKIINAKNKEILARMENALSVRSIEKSSGVAPNEFGGKRVLLRIEFENTGEEDIQDFHAEVSFMDKDGKALRTVTIKDTDIMSVGDIVEKSWPMAMNPLSANDDIIFKANNTDLVINHYIKAITFTSGEKLELINTQK